MAYEPGTELGPYRITGPLGAGGMGEVYRATDTKLHRDVAIKVLPEAFARDEQRMKRFEREAQVLASLNHPNIAAIYGLEGGALVLELVEGPTLADRIRQGPIPVEEALPLARQMAEALSEAHDKGIVHRDFKPANVKLTEAGRIKVLDFGLAKALGEADDGASADSGLSQSPTLTRQATVLGMILGTAAYMSPEQAKGKRVDRRTDVWAFGVVLYEMLTGKRAFEGEDVSETLAAVLRAEPAMDALPADTPAGIRRLLGRTFRKNPAERLADMSDVRLEIDEAFERQDVDPSVSVPSETPRSPLALGAFLLVAVTALATWWVTRGGAPEAPPLTRFTVAPPASDSDTRVPAVSPDGALLVYPATRDGAQQLFVRARGSLQVTPLRGTEGADYPFFSPDGAWVGFFAGGSLKKVPVAGGPARVLCPAGTRFGASWGRDDTIVFSSSSVRGLMRVASEGGEPSALTSPPDGIRHNWPRFLPDGKNVLFTISRSGPVSDKEVALLSLETGETRALLEGTSAVYARAGYLVFGREASLWAAPFDLDALRMTGTATPVVEDVQVNPGGGLAYFDLANDGTLAYWTGNATLASLVRVDRHGTVVPLLRQAGAFASPRFSPDGSRVAMELDGSIWILDISRGALTRLTTGYTLRPVWSPDGASVAYMDMGGDGNIYEKPADGSGDAKVLGSTEHKTMVPSSWTPDGADLMLYEFGSPAQLYTLVEGGTVEKFRSPSATHSERGPEISPDGRWLLYMSDETDSYEVYLQPFPGPGERIRVSLAGGLAPSWSRDGREIFYVDDDRLMVVPFDGTTTPPVGRPRELLSELRGLAGPITKNYDPSPDGQSFVAVLPIDSEGARELHVVLNWFTELKERVRAE
jgi:eukaryotic-like serine/threonine-protein kinase